MKEPSRLQSMGLLRVGHDWAILPSLSCIGEGNGKPFQCSCLEKPRDRGAPWAAVYGVAQSWTRLKRLSSRATKHTSTEIEVYWMGKILEDREFCLYFPASGQKVPCHPNLHLPFENNSDKYLGIMTLYPNFNFFEECYHWALSYVLSA